MIRFFVLQIKMGNLTIEQLPERYRAEVAAAYTE